MDLIKKKIDAYILSLIEKDELTPEEYAVLSIEHEKRKAQSERESEDTIMRIFKTLN